ncbi:DUF2252 domain-containing protein [Leptolyngbya sp. FACHB-17]|uniref:DUF2252 domain-containing protein n=1 Tax=unclassified Leptolyngbya TaxID=2650499 RepID=UPI00168011C4|nr:DUF2252 domain-containing protein [Leptolyngbya sp. FACHB-17]MBD2080519.1 DUF2252 domain-containing protein [Leptolyngbya sp. FACHB-17]
MPNQSVVDQIREFNRGRNLELLRLKYKTMQKDAFGFLRGTCHLFYQDLPVEGMFRSAPPVWICGDLHLQNFGTFKGDDRLVYFDVNDFDEALLAPCTWDITRLVTSIIVGAHTLNISDEDALALCDYFLEIYTKELSTGKDRTVHSEISTGLVKELIDNLKTRKRKDFLDERTEVKGKQRSLKLIEGKTTPVTEAERQKVTDAIAECAATQPNPEFYQVLDVMHRVAGTGSLGLDRYVILVEGNGSPNQNYLLDLKAARSSSLQPYTPYSQPNWKNEADRITAIQDRFQESPPALLTSLLIGNQPYVLRELQPTADRVNLESKDGKTKQLKKVIKTMAEVTAWGQMRSTGRQNSAIADDLIAFSQTAQEWHPNVIDYARSYAAQVEQDYQEFKTQAEEV